MASRIQSSISAQPPAQSNIDLRHKHIYMCTHFALRRYGGHTGLGFRNPHDATFLVTVSTSNWFTQFYLLPLLSPKPMLNFKSG